MQGKERSIVLAACLVLFAAAPAVAYANAGVPMLAFVWPLSWVALIPVVAIEGAIGRKMAGLGWGRAIGATAAANALSTFVGIPLTWAALVAVQMLIPNGGGAELGIDTLGGKLFAVTAQAGWLLPWEAQMYWMVPAALLFMLPFFGIVSVYTERPVFRWIAKCEKDIARAWSWNANLTTYGIMMAAVLVWLLLAIVFGLGK